MQTGHRRFYSSAGRPNRLPACSAPRGKVRERQSCKWRLCPTEGSCADLTPGQSLHLIAKSSTGKRISNPRYPATSIRDGRLRSQTAFFTTSLSLVDTAQANVFRKIPYRRKGLLVAPRQLSHAPRSALFGEYGHFAKNVCCAVVNQGERGS